MPIAFLTNDYNKLANGVEVPGGCAYYRCSLPMFASGLPAMMGRPAFHPTFGFGVKDKDQAVFRFDTVMLKLIMFRWTPRQIMIAQQLGQRIIVDVDDAFDYLPEVNAAFELTHPDKNKVMNRDHYRNVIAAADTLTVSTPFLADHYRDHRDVRMVRNGVHPGMFHRKHQSARPVIGWVGSVAYRGGDLELLRGWLPQFLEKHDLYFHHSGNDPNTPCLADVVGIPMERFSCSPLATMDEYYQLFEHFDIGLVPLNDIPFNHAKSTIKGLEYASAGVPFVASGLPEYQRLADDGVGRIANTSEDWVRHLTELLDFGVRKKEAAQQRVVVAERHSIQAREAEWQGVFTRTLCSSTV